MNCLSTLRLAPYMLKGSAVRLSISLLVAALATVSTPGSAGEAIGPQPSASSTAQAQWVGVFTGKQVNGVPVYRLPPVTVIANRKLELAKIEREVHLARAKPARSKAAARSPV